MFDGTDADGFTPTNGWASGDHDLGYEGLKRVRQLWFEGRIAPTQTVRVEVSVDNADYVELGEIDVRDCMSLQSWIRYFDERHPIDWFIANAGISASIQEGRHLEQIEDAHQVIHTNLMGVIDSMDAIVPLMCVRNRGQIGLVSSLAALRGMALTPVYSASKAGVKAYGEALRDLLAPSGVGVSIICPGFVETPMSDRFPGPRPQMLSPERAAQKIIRGLARNQAYIDFPWHFAFGLRLLSILPFGVGSFMLRLLSLQAK
jgi:short-subunit dehydrogenase